MGNRTASVGQGFVLTPQAGLQGDMLGKGQDLSAQRFCSGASGFPLPQQPDQELRAAGETKTDGASLRGQSGGGQAGAQGGCSGPR